MRRQARAFKNVALDLADKIMALLGNSRDYVSPFLVNAAFAMELFLKALAQHHGVSLRGHSLLKLYDELPPVARSAVERALSGVSMDLADFDGSSDLRGLFTNLDDAFLAWRYTHERNGDGRFYGAKAAVLLLALLDEATVDINLRFIDE
jgi:HEPN domain-containing protein